MDNVLLVVHVIVALAIVGLIMLQQGKGAEMGASFGAGSSQTVFGAAGSGNFFSRLTAILVAVFFCTSLVLAILSKDTGDVDAIEVPGLESLTEDVGTLESLSDDVPSVEGGSEVMDDVPMAEPEAALEVEVPEAATVEQEAETP